MGSCRLLNAVLPANKIDETELDLQMKLVEIVLSIAEHEHSEDRQFTFLRNSRLASLSGKPDMMSEPVNWILIDDNERAVVLTTPDERASLPPRSERLN